ncbi:MAG: Gmad2 immunoglobulin-like domain-containing protein [Pseudonocardia sp.]
MLVTTCKVLTVLLVALAAAGCAQTRPEPGSPAPVTSSPAPAPPGAQERAVPVYFVAETPSGPRLYREFHRIMTADPASDAVREMLRGPLDPDYRTPWPSGTALRAPVTAADGVITVDLTLGSGSAQVGTAGAEMTVQQLVYTVQGALQSSDPVRILVDGAPVPELFGAVATAEPVARGDQYAVRSLFQIDSPAEGATVGSPVTVSGEAAAFEANVPWEVRQDGRVVQRGFATAEVGQQFAAFRFTVTLPPGTYEVKITEDDPSGGEGRPPFTDDKTFTVM